MADLNVHNTNPEMHKAIVRRYIEETNNGGQVALVDELIAPDYVGCGGLTNIARHLVVYRLAARSGSKIQRLCDTLLARHQFLLTLDDPANNAT